MKKIKPYPRNARSHSDEQVDLIANSMKKFGVTAPLLVDEDGVLIYGHGRLQAATKLGYANMPVSVARGWSEQEKNAYRIMDNQLALRSNWDDVLLRQEFHELKNDGFDTQFLGFEDGQLSSLTLLDPQVGSNSPIEHWQGMPSYDQDDQTAYRTIVVHLVDQAAVDEFKKFFPGQAFTDKTKSLYFPTAPKDDVRDEEWVSEE